MCVCVCICMIMYCTYETPLCLFSLLGQDSVIETFMRIEGQAEERLGNGEGWVTESITQFNGTMDLWLRKVKPEHTSLFSFSIMGRWRSKTAIDFMVGALSLSLCLSLFPLSQSKVPNAPVQNYSESLSYIQINS